MRYAPDVAPISDEMRSARAKARAEGEQVPIRLLLAKFTAAREQRSAEGAEAARALWGSPPTGSFARGDARWSGPRNGRFVSGPPNPQPSPKVPNVQPYRHPK
jgi:hypothetical protein